jgi:hypothetical protein
MGAFMMMKQTLLLLMRANLPILTGGNTFAAYL